VSVVCWVSKGLIATVQARMVLDSRGVPTLACQVSTVCGALGHAMIPSGASVGSKEAIELRDGGSAFLGKGVSRAIAVVNDTLAPLVQGMLVTDQMSIDEVMIAADGTPNKRRLGANAILAVSLAVAHAASSLEGVDFYRYLAGNQNQYCMPVPLMNVINGGAHANNNISIQEFMIVPVGFNSFSRALQCGAEVFQVLKSLLAEKGFATGVGDEGGFAPHLKDDEAALQLLVEAITKAGYIPGKDVYLALDIAASELYQSGSYHLGSKRYSKREWISLLQTWVDGYPILSIEDAMDEEDWEGWQELTEILGHRVQLVGDDIFVTHEALMRRGAKELVANSILIKLNQVGTLSETLSTIKAGLDLSYTAIISHRSGETEDTTIADLAVATGVGQIKTGSLCRSERVAKYNRLLSIEAGLGSKAFYPGMKAFSVDQTSIAG
jgi:enolase